MEQTLAFEELFIKCNTEPTETLIMNGDVDAIKKLIAYADPDVIKKLIVSGKGTLTMPIFKSLVILALKEKNEKLALMLISWSTSYHMLMYL